MSHFCCIPCCDKTRTTPGVKLFQVPHGATSRGYETIKCSESMKEVLYKYRALPMPILQKRIANICSLHFEESDIVKC